MALTTLKVKHAGPGRHADMHGLYLLVRDSGARSWVLRMQHAGRRRDFGLGPAQDVPLADARILAANLRKAVRSGEEPESRRRAGQRSAPTFEKVTRDCYDAMKGGWKDQRHVSWISSFERHVFPLIGAKAVTAIDSAAVLTVLEPIWLTVPDGLVNLPNERLIFTSGHPRPASRQSAQFKPKSDCEWASDFGE